jgi:4-amino-4-deoxy-L-arabinose transferase-like glycosyltransferase
MVALAVILVVVWIGALVPRELAKSDEGRYAEISREMVATGDWLTPRLDGLKYFEKPPLQYWATAVFDEAFGLHEWTARLWTGLTGLFGLAFLGWATRRVYGPTTALYSLAVLASSLLYVLIGHVDTLDMGLTGFMTGTLSGVLVALFGIKPGDRLATLIAWSSAALAVLSKGLIGLVLPGAVVVLYMALARDWRVLSRLRLPFGVPLFFLIASPWFIAVSIANPDFAHFFFIHEHVDRFLTHEHNRVGPWWYFIPILAAGSLPWLTLLPFAAKEAALAPEADNHDATRQRLADRFLLLWALFIFLFFSLSGSKLPSYILPIMPALAVLVARVLVSSRLFVLVWHARAIALLAAAGISLSLTSGLLAGHPDELAGYGLFGRVIAIGAAALLIGALVAARAFRLGRRQQGVLTIAGASILAAVFGLCGYTALDRFASAKYVADVITPVLTPDTEIYSVEAYEQTLPFYLRRTMTLVNHRDELDFGLTAEPSRWVPTLEGFARAWQGDSRAIAVMPPSTFDKLRLMSLSYRILLADRRFVVIAKP